MNKNFLLRNISNKCIFKKTNLFFGCHEKWPDFPSNVCHFQFDQFVEFDSFLVEKWGPLDRRVARNFLGQGRVPQIRAQTFGSSESQSYM